MRPPMQRKRISEYKDRLLEIRRVTRVMAGGKRFSFRATVVVGNLRGKVGVGVAKGVDVMSAVEKARRQGEKRIKTVYIVENRTIPHMVEAKYGAARVRIKPAAAGHGLIAGGSTRAVLELAGVRDVSAKILSRTKNKLSNAMATLEALSKIRAPKKAAEETPVSKP
ncbi:MAG: 30S ribosomal protein S5 [Candidatus Jorgensenbacteria bacterium]